MGNSFFTAALALLLLLNIASLTCVAGDDARSQFLQLSGYHIGHSHPRLVSVKRYLRAFGYLDNGGNTEFSEEFDAELEAAIKKYQQFVGLDASGVLDSATVNQMGEPRCGNNDLPASGTPSGNWSAARFVIGGKPWSVSRRDLTYVILSANQPFAPPDLSRVIRAAFATWAVFAPFTFREVTDPNSADLHIGFYWADHGDGNPFDGPLGVLAHAFYPEDGRAHFDAAEKWEIDPAQLAATPSSVDIQTVALHELGHVLGMAHSKVGNAVMWPYVALQATKRQLTDDDIAGIRALYLSS